MPNWHPEDIKTAVRKTEISLAELGRRSGLSPNTTQAAIRRPQPSGNLAIANHLGLKLHEIWPEWFDAANQRITSPNQKPSTQRAPRQSKSARDVNTPIS